MFGWKLKGDHALPFPHGIEAVRRQIRQRLLGSIGPKDLSAIQRSMAAQPEVQAQIVLRQVASAAAHLAKLRQIARRDLPSLARPRAPTSGVIRNVHLHLRDSRDSRSVTLLAQAPFSVHVAPICGKLHPPARARPPGATPRTGTKPGTHMGSRRERASLANCRGPRRERSHLPHGCGARPVRSLSTSWPALGERTASSLSAPPLGSPSRAAA